MPLVLIQIYLFSKFTSTCSYTINIYEAFAIYLLYLTVCLDENGWPISWI